MKFLKNADAGAGNGQSSSDNASDSQKDESGTQKTDSAASDSQQSQQGKQSDSAKGTDSRAADTEKTEGADDIETLKKQLADLLKEKQAANKEAMQRRKANGEFEALLKEKEAESENLTTEVTTLRARVTELEGYEKQVKALEKTEHETLLKEIPEEKRGDFKDFTNAQLRIFLREKAGNSQSQGTENGGKPNPAQQGTGLKAALFNYYNGNK